MENHEILTIGNLIEQKRRDKQMPQEELAFNCRIVRKTMSNIETDKHLPGLPLFVKIAQALDMRGHELLKDIEYRGLLGDLFRTDKRH
ncbi:helix-turn-helix transcriptional regulator [Neobacillus sp.]|uniref:helix-turn-helix transcriptional regulator n=1 Tax=Neobacillus sp. TaxID=2675273 RepID=UPI00289997CC|nr:helix-turn-helix transcriptional regulator [Neobacillus sp.]